MWWKKNKRKVLVPVLVLLLLAAAFWYGIRADAHHAETLAAIAPRLRGAYRGCYRPPVP